MRVTSALIALLISLPALAQQAELICISVGDASTYTVVVMYGRDGSMVAMQIPPEGLAEDSETTVLQHAENPFEALERVLLPGLEALPTPPTPEACADDIFGAVALAVQIDDAPALTYVAACATPEVLALNESLIEATGDPLGDEINSWTTPTIPLQRDICRDLQ